MKENRLMALFIARTHVPCFIRDGALVMKAFVEICSHLSSAGGASALAMVHTAPSSRAVLLPVGGDQQQSSLPRVSVLGIDLTNSPRWMQLLVCSTAVFIFYVGYGYMQELIFKLDGMRPFGWYLTLVQFMVYSIFAFLESKMHRHETRRIPIKIYIQLAFYTVATMGLSNASVGYLNYPTQVIFKCCKLIPVLIGGILIQGKRFGFIDVIAACLMSFGLILFTLADSKVAPNFNSKGYIMISLALVADAIIGNVQEKAMKSYKASNNEVVLYSYSIGSLYILVGTVLDGEIFAAVPFFAQHPIETYCYAFIFSILGYLGVNVVLTLVKTFGALLAVTITTMRKAVTIILSFILFSKPFTDQYIWSGMIVLAAIYLNIYSKHEKEWNAKAISMYRNLMRHVRNSDRHRFTETV